MSNKEHFFYSERFLLDLKKLSQSEFISIEKELFIGHSFTESKNFPFFFVLFFKYSCLLKCFIGFTDS